MAVREIIGHIACVCGFPDAEVKKDKNGNPYMFCPDCEMQALTHGKEPKASRMLAKMRPIVKPEEAAPVPVPTPTQERKFLL